MKKGHLSQYFQGVAIKRLSAVEADTARSNQHEFNGSRPLRNLLGDERMDNYPARFIWLGGENETISANVPVTWYDSRANQTHRAAEYRLYFQSNAVMDQAREGDLLIVAKRPTDELYLLVAEAGSTFESQLLWLFDVSENIETKFEHRQIEESRNLEVDFAVRFILDEIGIEVQEPEPDSLDEWLIPYQDSGFPTTIEFSKLARNTLSGVSPLEDPDHALLEWMNREEQLFKRLESHIITKQLEAGFRKDSVVDVEGFIQFSLSVQNRRKSRVGYALENHLEEIFKEHSLQYSRNKITENKARPDFLFPSIQLYKDPSFDESRLTMLGVKSTCKDRWRQVLTEAKRIENKHLFTLEPGISSNQTEEMKDSKLQLILPTRLHATYKPDQQAWLMNLATFLDLVKGRQ